MEMRSTLTNSNYYALYLLEEDKYSAVFVLWLALLLFVPQFPFIVGWKRCRNSGHTYVLFSVTPKKAAAVL